LVGLLADLDRAGERVSVIHVGTGLLGVGATQLAAAYARAKLEAGWRLVAWVNGADTGGLLAGLAAVADATGLTGDDSGPASTDAAVMVRPWLEADGDHCLLVFDDVSDPELLQAFVPAHGMARVLITSTRRSAANLGSVTPVDAFSVAEATAYLARRTGLNDEAGAAAAAAVMEYLPLPLALAAPVIAGQHIGYAGYLDRLQATPTDLSLTGDDGRPYPSSSTRTVLLSLQAVRAADRTGVCARVMEIMAVLSAAGVRRELLYAAGQAGVLASGRHRVAAGLVDRVLEWLSRRSLLTFSLDGQTVILHRLVARVIRDELARRQMLTAVCEAAAFMLDVYSRALVGSQDRRAIRGISQHLTALLDSLAGPMTEVDEELAWLLLRLRFAAFYHLLELGDSASQAIAIGEPLAEDLGRRLGPDHPDTMNSRNSLAAAYLAAGRVAEAIPLFEEILDARQRMLGPDDPETLTLQNNLACAYQDGGRVTEAIPLLERTLADRERVLGPDHPGTLTSRGNLAGAYRDAGRAVEAIPLLERTLADRERVLGPDHPDTLTSRGNLAGAYRDAGRVTEAIPLLERTLADRERVWRSDHSGIRTGRKNLAAAYRDAGRAARAIPSAGLSPAARKSQPPDGATGQMLRHGFRQPPAGSARRVLPVGFRRPPIDPARQPLVNGIARPPARLTDHSTSRTQNPSGDIQHDREIVAAITAEDPAGIAMAYDRYAADLYGYCDWMLQDPAGAARALQDTFVIAPVTLGNLSEPSELRPRLFALARNECQRWTRSTSAACDEEADAASQQADAMGLPTEATDEPSDATVRFRAVGEPSDATVRFRAVGEPSDATVRFRAVGEPSDATVRFRAVGEPSDATNRFRVLSQPTEATIPFRVLSQPTDARNGLAHINGDQGQAELRTLVYSILAGLKPREREIIELSFRHDLHDNDLAIALDVSLSRAHALASRTRGQLEETLSALHIALTRREACSALGELLADWNGQPTEQMRDLVSPHIEECQACAQHGWGSLRPAAVSRLLPLAPLPVELREQVMRLCFSTAEDAVAYRRRVARHAEWIWVAKFSRAIRQVSWNSVRANPGVAIATAAIAVWVVAALSASLLTFVGSHAARVQPVQASVGTSSRSPAVAPTQAAVSISATATPSPTASHPSAHVSLPAQPARLYSHSPSYSTPYSSSPKPSKSQSSSPSRTASPSPSPTTSPSPSPTPAA
jgi:RNA polymerase sigma factor (sigma-70 family)